MKNNLTYNKLRGHYTDDSPLTPFSTLYLNVEGDPEHTRMKDYLNITDSFHKLAVSKIRTPKFIGFSGDTRLSEEERTYYIPIKDKNQTRNISSIALKCNTPFTEYEIDCIRDMKELWLPGKHNLKLTFSDVDKEFFPSYGLAKTITNVHPYTTRKVNEYDESDEVKFLIQREIESQVINSVNYKVNQNPNGVVEKINFTEFEKNSDGWITAPVPNFGYVSVKHTKKRKTKKMAVRGNRTAAMRTSFEVMIDLHGNQLNYPCISPYHSHFGAGYLEPLGLVL